MQQLTLLFSVVCVVEERETQRDEGRKDGSETKERGGTGGEEERTGRQAHSIKKKKKWILS